MHASSCLRARHSSRTVAGHNDSVRKLQQTASVQAKCFFWLSISSLLYPQRRAEPYRCPNGPSGTGTIRTRFGPVQIVPSQARPVNGSGRAVPTHVLRRVPKHGTSMPGSCRAGPKTRRAKQAVPRTGPPNSSMYNNPVITDYRPVITDYRPVITDYNRPVITQKYITHTDYIQNILHKLEQITRRHKYANEINYMELLVQ
jgi:hypothetical protein